MITLLPLLFLLVMPVLAASPSVSEAIAKGDAAYARRSDPDQAQLALRFYEQALLADPQNTEAYWKASAAAWWAGEWLDERRARMDFFETGIRYGEKAVDLYPQSAEAHFWLGVNYGSFGDTKGVLKSLFLIKPIRSQMEIVNHLNERYQDGGADRVLGILDYKVPGFAGGDKWRAGEWLKKAYDINPWNPITLYYLGEYASVQGDRAKAIEWLDKLQPDAFPTELHAELKLMQKKAAALRAKLK